MKKFYASGNECSQLQKAEHKLKQLKEAENLLEDLSWRISWALDFSEYNSINEELEPALQTIDEAYSNIEEQRERMEEQIEKYKEDKSGLEIEYDNESELQYYLN